MQCTYPSLSLYVLLSMHNKAANDSNFLLIMKIKDFIQESQVRTYRTTDSESQILFDNLMIYD